MNAPTITAASAESEINRLHDEASRLSTASKESLLGALAAAWQAGRLLTEEKERVRQKMGRGAWLLWVEQRFHGSIRTAQNYMRLAQTFPDVSALQGLSLRQIYYRLQIPTEPKSRLESARGQPLPARILLAGKLLEEVRACVDARYATTEQLDSCRRDLRPLYEQLRRLFEPNNRGIILKNAGIIQDKASRRW
jgi:hypothetical protein